MIFETTLLLTTFVFLVTLANLPLNVRCQDRSCIDIGDNYPTNGTYHSNLNTLLASLPTNITVNGFYNASLGRIPDRVNAIALCRPDIQLDTCRECVLNSTIQIVNLCPNMRQAIVWNLLCMLRYSNMPITGIMSTVPGQEPHSPMNITNFGRDPVAFMADLRILLNDLRMSAAYRGNSLYKVAGSTQISANVTIYGLAQCTPDLSTNNCNSCLANAIDRVPGCCDRRIGARILRPSCILRYEISPFYDEGTLEATLPQLASLGAPPPLPPSPLPPPPLPPSPLPPPPLPHSPLPVTRGNRFIVSIIVVSVVASIMLAAVAALLVRRRTKQKPMEEFEPEGISGIESLQHDFHKIRAATNDFAEANKLGQGGFGVVYKGHLNGEEVAVKRLSKNSSQGVLEFKNEVVLLARLKHRNLVRLLGFALRGTEKLLVYEFLPNASLEKIIFDQTEQSRLDWHKRYKIILGIAKGLLYLHEDSQMRIIHRDLKLSNILLDSEMNPKIADFGMARLFVPDDTHELTKRIVGTYGYMAPEYAIHGQFSVKSDVFSFGVLVLEIISGRKNITSRNSEDVDGLLISIAWKCWRDGTPSDVINPVLKSNSGTLHEILRCIQISLLCVQGNAAVRPTMASIFQMLSSDTVTVSIPSAPAYTVETNETPDGATTLSVNEVSISEFCPR